MENLKKLVFVLKPQEIFLLHEHIGLLIHKEKESVRLLKLFDLLCHSPLLTKKDILEQLNLPNEGKILKDLCKELKIIIFETLVSPANINLANTFSSFFVIKYNTSRHIFLTSILLGRGLYSEVEILYEELIKTCKKYEFYNELLEVLYLKQSYLGLYKSMKAYEGMISEIEHFEGCRSALIKMKHYQQMYLSSANFKGASANHPVPDRNMIDWLKKLYKPTKSANILYFLLLIKIYYYQKQEKFGKAKYIFEELIELVKNNPAVHVRRRLGTLYLNISEMCIYLDEFEEALKLTYKAQENLNANSYNFALSISLQFYSYFYSGKYMEAESVMSDLILNHGSSLAPFIKSKYVFMQLCALFYLKKHKEIFRRLSEISEIEIDKEGWNIGVRIFIVMHYIERGFIDLAETSLEAIRKHIERTAQLQSITQRDKYIVAILKDLVKNELNFENVYKKRKKEFSLLQSKKSNLSWKYFTHEVIPFHEWFIQKIKEK